MRSLYISMLSMLHFDKQEGKHDELFLLGIDALHEIALDSESAPRTRQSKGVLQ
jgi:hypothetical protein